MKKPSIATVLDVLEGRAQWCVVCADNRDELALIPDKAVDVIISDPPYAPRAMKNAEAATRDTTAGGRLIRRGDSARVQVNKDRRVKAKSLKHKGAGDALDRLTTSMTQRRDGQVYDFGYAGLLQPERLSMAKECARLAERWVVIWCDIESDELWRRALAPHRHPDSPVKASLEYVRTGVWVRTNPAPQFSGDRPGQGVEACIITKQEDAIDGIETYIIAHPENFHATRMPVKLVASIREDGMQGKWKPAPKFWNGGGNSAVYIGPIVNSQAGDRFHSSPKPLWLMLRQVKEFSMPGDLILDPYCGSASTGVAAIRLGRRFIGIELNEKFANDARERMEAESRGLSVSAARGGQRSIFDALAETPEEATEMIKALRKPPEDK